MLIISQYHLMEVEPGCFHVNSYEVNACPVCGYTVAVIGTRRRKFINTTGDKQTLIIRRLRCKDCRVIHHELPDILIPYKRHCAETVENVVSGNEDNVCCENHTIRRIKEWWAACRLYFEGILSSLREKYGDVLSLEPAPREIVRAVTNANFWIHTRSASLSG